MNGIQVRQPALLLVAVLSLAGEVRELEAGEAMPVPDPDALVFDTPEATELGGADSMQLALTATVAGTPPLDSSPVLSPEEQQARLERDVRQYQQAVRELEAEGAWTAGLSQDLLGLGQTLQAMGEHEQAIPVFERASHVARVNRGLHTMDQLPALEERIDSHLALGQWEEADQQQQYSFYLHSRAMPRDDPGLVGALRDFAHWNLSVHFRGLEETPARLIDAYRLLNSAHDLLLEREGDDLERQLAYLDSLTGVAWLVARTHIGDSPEVLNGNRAFNETALVSFHGRQQSKYQINGFAQGEAALQRAVDLQVLRLERGEASLADAVEALARLGDWYLLFDRRQASTDAYRQAWNLLREQEAAQPETVFDSVEVLPRFTSFAEQRRFAARDRLPQGMQRGHVDVRLDVNRYGRADDVEVIGGDPVTIEEVGSRLSRNLRAMRLRPRIENGEPVDAEDVLLRLPYWY
ncbi:MAG: hypothetical protein WEB57_13475 [Pseudohongiellaceae bacterium]